MNIILNINIYTKQHLTKRKLFLQHILPSLIFTEIRLIRQMNIICIYEWGNWNSERLSDLLKITQLIRRKVKSIIRCSIFGSKPSSFSMKDRSFMIWSWLLLSLSYTPARLSVLQSFLLSLCSGCSPAWNVPSIRVHLVRLFLSFKTQAMCHIFTHLPRQSWKLFLYNSTLWVQVSSCHVVWTQ